MSRPAVVPKFRVPKTQLPVGRWGVVSVAFHALLLLLVLGSETGMFDSVFGTGGGRGPAGGGGGGGAERVTYVELPAYIPAATATPVPTEEEEVRFDPAQPSVRQIPLPDRNLTLRRPAQTLESISAIGSDRGTGGGEGRGPGSGGGIGTGLGTGTGSHTGPGTGGNQPYVYAPEPRATPHPVVAVPAELRGEVLTIHFWVDARGRVTRVEITPPIRDSEYREALRQTLLGWTFYAARTASGAQVAGEMEYSYHP